MTCRACGEEHDAWIRCEVARALVQKVRAGPDVATALDKPVHAPQVPRGSGGGSEVPKRGLGRPRIYADPKARRREYMKEYRARKAGKAVA